MEKYREILQDRLDRYEESYPWYCLHRERDESKLSAAKIVTPRWGGDLKSFAYQTGEFYENSDLNVLTLRPEARENLKYVLGLLNSKVVQCWMSEKAKQKGLTRQSMLYKLPIRRIDFSKKREVAKHDRIVRLVDQMSATKQQLAKLNRFFAIRLTRLTGPDQLPEPDIEAVTRSLKGAALRRLHNHPKVTVQSEHTGEFILTRVGDIVDAAELFTKRTKEHRYALRLSGKGRKKVTVIAPKEILRYLHQILAAWKGKSWDEIKELPIAKDLVTYRAKEKQIVSEARKLLRKTVSIQTKIDALVYDLYGLTDKEIKIVEQSLQPTVASCPRVRLLNWRGTRVQ